MSALTSVHHRVSRPTAIAGLAACLLAAALVTPAARADDDLTQTIDPNQAQGEGQTVLDEGHIDIGPTLGTGEFILEAHDDTGETSVWRRLSDVVVEVNDEGMMTMPDDDTYSFIGAEPGSSIWMIPQTQQTGVAWLGWNTQEPQLMQTVSGGVTFSLLGIEGPGDATVYLQSGNFGAPEVIWSSQNAFPQDSWIEVNTHTHANWAFTEKGLYLMRFRISATTLAGDEISTEDTLRIAVGSDADTDAAFAAQWEGEPQTEAASGAQSEPSGGAPASDQGAPLSGAAAGGSGSSSAMPVVLAGAGIVAAALLIAAIAFVVSGRRARQRVWEARRAADEQAEQKHRDGTSGRGTSDE
jgi:putative ABC transporter-associated repeat protein